jgi:hypothetical protein
MPATNTSRSPKAPIAPHQAVVAGTNATATASSASGSKIPSGAARAAGTPNSPTACREPARSASFATPATAKTRASNNLAHRRVASMTKLSFRQSTRSIPAKSVYLKRMCALASSEPGLRRKPHHTPPGRRSGPFSRPYPLNCVEVWSPLKFATSCNTQATAKITHLGGCASSATYEKLNTKCRTVKPYTNGAAR